MKSPKFFPEAVLAIGLSSPDISSTAEGVRITTGPTKEIHMVNYQMLVAHLINAVNELTARVITLENK